MAQGRTASGAATPPLALERVSKSFGPVAALSEVDLVAHAGQVLALMGENGAGKSTLLRILGGVHAPDTGRILLDGQVVSFASPAAARRAGVRVVAQEPEIIPHVTVAENIYVGSLPHRGWLMDREALIHRTQADILAAGMEDVIEPGLMGHALSPAQRQIVEILRALHGEPRVIAFDEPTSSLSDHEVDALFRLIRILAARGLAVIYVSHRMAEIFSVATRVLVLRDGRGVGERETGDISSADLVRMMVGRDLSAMFPRSPHQRGEIVLRVRGLRNVYLDGIDLDVHAGEVLVLAGLVGAGRSELARTILGDLPREAGEMWLDGAPLAPRSPHDSVSRGIALAPEERKAEGLLLKRSIADNVALGVLRRISRFHLVDRTAERALAERYTAELSIRTPSITQEVSKLSGGNQQKVVLARLLAWEARLLILDEPTRGVDVGAKAEIYAIIDRLAAAGKAVLVISSELPEVIGLADRVAVMQQGRISGVLDRAEATEERILSLAILDHTEQTA